MGGRRGSGEGEDGRGERRGGFVFGVRFGWVGWDGGENEVVGIGELPGVVSGGADEVAAHADGVFLGVEIDAGEPEFAVGGARVGAAGGGDVEVGDGKAFRVDEGAGNWVGSIEMPGADQRGWRAERDLKVVPADGDEDGLDDEEGGGEDNLGDEDGDAPGASAGRGNPGGGRRGGFVAPEESVEGEGVGQGEEDAAEEQVDGEELDGDVVAEVVENHVGDHKGGEEGASEGGAAIEKEDAAEDLGGAADYLVDGVKADEVPKEGHRSHVAGGLVEDGDGGRRHLERKDFDQAVDDHEHAAGKTEEETKPCVEGAVLGATVVPEVGDEGPNDAASQRKGEQEGVLDPVHRGVAGFAWVPVGCDAGEMEEMLPGELGEMVEGPVKLVLDPAADDREGLKEGSVAVEKDEAEEVEEGDAEAEAGCGAPGSGRRACGDGGLGWGGDA